MILRQNLKEKIKFIEEMKMRSLFVSFLGLIAFTAISCGSPEESGNVQGDKVTEQTQVEMQNVSTSDLKKAITMEADIIVLDVRTSGEVSEGYIENAVNMDVNQSTFLANAEKLDRSKTVYVYCRSGHRSHIASKKLIELGFTDVRNVEGGFMAWSQAGFDFVK
jgi:rhodanese-related sulfurtransferase